MQNAPSVIYPLGHFAFYRFVLVCLGGCSAALMALGWWASWAESPGNTSHGIWASGFGVWALWCAVTWAHLPSAPSGSLHWNAQAPPGDLSEHAGAWLWQWNDPSRPPESVRVVPILDGQTRVLLRILGVPSLGCWMWFEQTTHPQRWDDFRRALTAHAQ